VTYQRQLENQINELDKRIGELRVRALAAREEVREENTRMLDDLTEKREEAVDSLQDMKAQTGKSWDDARAKADAALNEYRKTYEETASRIR
jgi:TolA-binding protein